MHIGFLNPQGNFDPQDSYLTEHPDFGGQLVYVKCLAIAMAKRGHKVDILTRQIIDPKWPEFAKPLDLYPGVARLRIIRLPAGPEGFLPKEKLWPHLVRDWVPNIIKFYQDAGKLPDVMTGHYGDGGLSGVLINQKTGIPFTFTGHSLGAQKMDKLGVTSENLSEMDARYHFARRLMAERLSMNYSAINITSTRQERFQQYAHRVYRQAVDVSDNDRFAVIPPGCSLAIFGAGAYSDNEIATYEHVLECLERDLADGREELPAIVASSRLDPKKNHIGLVKAFAYSKVLQEKANLVAIAGGLENPLRDDTKAHPMEKEVLDSIRRVVQEHDLWGKVSVFSVGNQQALAATYRFLATRRSVFALTALYEPFGLAPLEAAAAGLPVVVTKNGGPSESLREGDEEYGVLVDPADEADIARGLERVLCDRLCWERFVLKGQQRVKSRYTWEKTAERYLQQLQKIIAAPKSSEGDGATAKGSDRLEIPKYFCAPQPANDISIEQLSHLYFGEVNSERLSATN